MIGAKRTLVSVLVAFLLVGTAGVSTWLMASAGVFTGTEQALPSAPESATETSVAAVGINDSLIVNSGIQVSQPRDPFDPLVVTDPGATTTTDPGDGGSTTTTQPGATTTTQPGATTTTQVGTTTTVGNQPDGIRVALLEIRTQNGALVAVVEVDGQTYTVGVGDTFATSFKVVSLTDNGGVFTFGSSAFTLAVGQNILK
jgi:hypothetical protein